MHAVSGQFEVIPTKAAAGAEIRGVDLSQPMDDETFARIEHSFDRFGVVFFRDQQITPGQQIDFGRRFGDIDINYNSNDAGLDDHPEIFIISNIVEGNREIGVPKVGATWHSDMCYAAVPPRATMLYALEVPVLNGLTLGDTAFANTAAAWDDLPLETKEAVQGLKANFDFQGRWRNRPPSPEVIAQYPPVVHPAVRTHPKTGRKSLYVMRDDCVGIEGLETEEALRLINALADHILKPQFIYRHQWQPGDVLIWDNCTVQHKAIVDYDLPQRRLIHRLTIAGTRPF
ncbi:MAG: TauD/TfdA family dioxygenase [Pseudomonadota bacterium]